MSPWVMVTAYLASSCWISTRSSVRVGGAVDRSWGCVISEDLAAFHYKIHLFCNTDIGEGITRYRDDIGHLALGQPAAIRHVDQFGGGRHAPVDERDEFVGVLPVWDGRCVGADSDFHSGFVRGLDRRTRFRE